MFLHALLFFLLSTSAFASPVGSRTRGTGSPTYLEPEIPYNYHVGYWYLVETTLVGEVSGMLLILAKLLAYFTRVTVQLAPKGS